MSKIGRNDPCPCGSGKKYKKCHGNGSLHEKKGKSLNYQELIKSFNPLQTLKLLGGLQLHPVNHGKNVLFEEMARLALLELRSEKGLNKTAYWDQLKFAIENYTERTYLEDEPTNSFTENVVYAEGNYTVYPGIAISGTRILNDLLECIFLVKNELPESYKKQINDAAGLLLFMSRSAADDAEHACYIYDSSDRLNIQFPDYETAVKYVNVLSFSKDYLKSVCDRHNYNHSIIKEFLFTPDDPYLDDDDPDQNITTSKPLLEDSEEFVLYMPTTVISALIDFIYRKAKEFECYEVVLDLLSE